MTPGEPSPGQLRRDPLPLRGRVALVTGVSRRTGIGYAIARRLAALGASLFLQQPGLVTGQVRSSFQHSWKGSGHGHARCALPNSSQSIKEERCG
jgi:hypothetical protein